MKIAFVDHGSHRLWDINTLKTDGLGGTEATVLRIAHGLSSEHKIFIVQAQRDLSDCEVIEQVTYCSCDFLDRENPDIVVVVAAYKHVETYAARYPTARTFLWLHNVPRWKLGLYIRKYKNLGIELIGVSDWHVSIIRKVLTRFRLLALLSQNSTPKVRRLYNPIPEGVSPDSTQREKNKLLFTSSPHKGLDEVIQKFQVLRETFPELNLYIANPGYNKLSQNLTENIHYLGELSHTEVIKHLRSAFCVFYPQTSKKETFGLVFAEANAVGTPVIAHNFGAASEILCGDGQAINCEDEQAILKTFTGWRESYPQINCRSDFSLESVLSCWRDLILEGKS